MHDLKIDNWTIVVRVKPRDLFFMGKDAKLDDIIDTVSIKCQILDEEEWPKWVWFDIDEDDIIQK